jgi:uncharacterized membrane protein (DUF485 family)
MTTDNCYWLFSAAAQSIAALVAFLMAGIALAFSMMDRLADQDESLYEVIESLKKSQYRNLAALMVGTGVAIICSLTALYANPWQSKFRDGITIFASVIDVAVIGGAIYFVTTIVMPGRYSRAAQKEYAEAKEKIEPVPGREPATVFFKEFIKLEQDIREFLHTRELYVPSRGAPKMTFSFRQMVDALYQNEMISKKLREMLFSVNKFRNLLFHGHMDQVDEGVLKELRAAIQAWNDEKSVPNK